MLESITNVISRVDEIKSHFRHARAEGVVHVAPHYEAGGTVSSAEVKPFFPDYLVKQVQTKVKGSVEEVSGYDNIIDSAAKKYGLDPALIKGIIRAESGFRANAVSGVGAQGLMQLMPATAAGLGVTDPFDPEQNIDAGARYIKGQLDRFGGDVTKALAAYNAGPGNVIKYDGVPPFKETQNYVNKVLSYRDDYAE